MKQKLSLEIRCLLDKLLFIFSSTVSFAGLDGFSLSGFEPALKLLATLYFIQRGVNEVSTSLYMQKLHDMHTGNRSDGRADRNRAIYRTLSHMSAHQQRDTYAIILFFP